MRFEQRLAVGGSVLAGYGYNSRVANAAQFVGVYTGF